MVDVDKIFKRGFGCMVRELIAWIVPGSPTASDILPQTVVDLYFTPDSSLHAPVDEVV